MHLHLQKNPCLIIIIIINEFGAFAPSKNPSWIIIIIIIINDNKIGAFAPSKQSFFNYYIIINNKWLMVQICTLSFTIPPKIYTHVNLVCINLYTFY